MRCWCETLEWNKSGGRDVSTSVIATDQVSGRSWRLSCSVHLNARAEDGRERMSRKTFFPLLFFLCIFTLHWLDWLIRPVAAWTCTLTKTNVLTHAALNSSNGHEGLRWILFCDNHKDSLKYSAIIWHFLQSFARWRNRCIAETSVLKPRTMWDFNLCYDSTMAALMLGCVLCSDTSISH